MVGNWGQIWIKIKPTMILTFKYKGKRTPQVMGRKLLYSFMQSVYLMSKCKPSLILCFSWHNWDNEIRCVMLISLQDQIADGENKSVLCPNQWNCSNKTPSPYELQTVFSHFSIKSCQKNKAKVALRTSLPCCF